MKSRCMSMMSSAVTDQSRSSGSGSAATLLIESCFRLAITSAPRERELPECTKQALCHPHPPAGAIRRQNRPERPRAEMKALSQANRGRHVGYSGVTVWKPDGKLIGRIRLPEVCGNICFGGPKRNRLFMAASQSLYAVYTATQGAGLG